MRDSTLASASPAALAAALAHLEAERDRIQAQVSVNRELVPLYIAHLGELNAQIAALQAMPQLAVEPRPLSRPAMPRVTADAETAGRG